MRTLRLLLDYKFQWGTWDVWDFTTMNSYKWCFGVFVIHLKLILLLLALINCMLIIYFILVATWIWRNEIHFWLSKFSNYNNSWENIHNSRYCTYKRVSHKVYETQQLFYQRLIRFQKNSSVLLYFIDRGYCKVSRKCHTKN